MKTLTNLWSLDTGDTVRASFTEGPFSAAWLDLGDISVRIDDVETARRLLEAARELCGWLETREEKHGDV